MPDPVPLRLLFLASPDTAGAAAVWTRAREAHAAGRPLDVLLSGAGLAWADDARLADLARSQGVMIGLCSRSARAHGVRPEALPSWVRWTSLVAFFTGLEPDAELWGVLP